MNSGSTSLSKPGLENSSTLKILGPSADHTPVFVSAHFHINLYCTQVVNYPPWQSREAIAVAGVDGKFAARMRATAQLSDGFTPMLEIF